jgi:hypothetical protein
MNLCLQYVGFVVNGSAIPDITFDIGESYAGLLPISQEHNETRQLYFWYVELFARLPIIQCLSVLIS